MAISISLLAERAGMHSRRWRMVMGVAAVISFVAVVFAFSRSGFFDARGIEVSGINHVSRGQILRAADVSKDTNVLWLDEDAVERGLESMPWVADADVHVTWRRQIEISVVERTAVAVATDGAVRTLMAADGTALGSSGATGRLPVIQLARRSWAEGSPPNPVGAARALGALAPALRSQVARVRVQLDGSLELLMRGGPRIEFGAPGDAARKAQLIRRMLAWAKTEGRTLRRLSVVSPFAPAAGLAP